MAVIDLTGIRFGRLVVIRRAGQRNSFALWACACDCGGSAVVMGVSLRRGATKSCGCLRRDVSTARFTTHGAVGTPEHCSWNAMLGRCNNPNNKKWSRYGGRGITVCERWREFENFLADMGHRPSISHSIDRINNEGNYEPSNCRWATQSQQQNNRSTNLNLSAFGMTMNLKQWSTHLSVDYSTLQRRLAKQWPLEKVLSKRRYTRTKKQAVY